MRALVLSDRADTAATLREILLREGHECQVAPVAPLGPVLGGVAEFRPEMLLVVLAPHAERALATLGAGACRGRCWWWAPRPIPR
jgi:hypothetical protein